MKKLVRTPAFLILIGILVLGAGTVLAKEQQDFFSLINFWETKEKKDAKKPVEKPAPLPVAAEEKPEALPEPKTEPVEVPLPEAIEKVEAKKIEKEAEAPKPAAPVAVPQEKPAPQVAEKQKPAEKPAAEIPIPAKKSKKAKKQRSDEILLVDDFDGGVRSNLLGGSMGEWMKDEYDDTQSCEIDFVERPRLGKSGGYSLQISYDVDSPNQAYNGVWIKLEGLDASEYKYLVLYLKAPNYPPYGSDNLKLELKNNKGESGSFQVKRIPRGAWREYKIPLKKFKGLKDLSELKELIIVFEDKKANPKEGIVFLEHVYFTKNEIRRPT